MCRKERGGSKTISVNKVVLCEKCGEGYFKVRDAQTPCLLCKSKEKTAVYDIDRSGKFNVRGTRPAA